MATVNGSYSNGVVKWFNSKHKYGFITVLSEGEYNNVDIFVHQSNIITKEPCYRFLVAGENVKFEIKKTDNEKHSIQAVNIYGVNNVTLKCEIPRPPRNELTNNSDGSRGGFRGGRGGFQGSGGRGGFQGSGGRGGFQGSGGGGGGRGGFQGSGGGRGGFQESGRRSSFSASGTNGGHGGHGGFRAKTTDSLTSTLQNIDINKA